MATTTHRTPGETFAGYSDLVTEVCPTCGVLHSFPTILQRVAKERTGPSGRQIHCPNGHEWHYTGSSMQKKLEREQEATRIARRERADAERAAQAQRAAATRARNERNRARKRSADGVCPCCGRTFKQIKRHMAAKHPDYDPAAA